MFLWTELLVFGFALIVDAQDTDPSLIIFGNSSRKGGAPIDWNQTNVDPNFEDPDMVQTNLDPDFEDLGKYQPETLTSIPRTDNSTANHEHLEKDAVITKTQHGFLKNKSRNTQTILHFQQSHWNWRSFGDPMLP
ncbi:uncharacterized protein LOC144327685 [Podarcis muralis]